MIKKNKFAVMLGSIKSEKKAKASRLNGKKGGRPKKFIDEVLATLNSRNGDKEIG